MILPAHMPSFKSALKGKISSMAKSHLLIWLEANELLTTPISYKSKQELMGLR
jgi:hypothetical protein